MHQNGRLFFCGIAVVALCLALSSRSVAAPEQAAAAHTAAPAGPAAVHEEPAHAAAPSVQEHAVAPSSARQVNSSQINTPQASANASRSDAIDRRAAQGDHRGDNHNQNRNYGNYGYAGYAYYPLGPSYDYWNPYWNNNNYNGPTYPGQFTQPDAAVSEPDPSANQSLSAQTAGEVTPPPSGVPMGVPDTTSAALNSALMASAQWRDADAQVRNAQSDYDAASAIVLAQLRSQPAYEQAAAQKAADAQKLNSIQKKDPAAPMDHTESAATAKLSAAQTITQMETAALAADPRASAAKAKLDSAITDRLEIRRQIEASIPKSLSAQ